MLATILMCLNLAQAPDHHGESNHLANETSPYLLQHAYNPVDWYPWGNEALELAKSKNLPIFLSIGYSACHWCHVMERESFEDEEIAKFLNTHFICIKVDREERPDLDDLYMTAVQRMTGSGGWPMSVFLTPDLRPFFGGTYFPPRQKYGKPGFFDILLNIKNAWRDREQEIRKSAEQLGDMLALNLPTAKPGPLPTPLKFAEKEQAWETSFTRSFDSTWGGFSEAPKFPHTDDIKFLLGLADRHGLSKAREMATYSLRKMADGGLYDQLAGGFARYSTDEKWIIPHFEKMLYDQGTLIPCYIEAWRQTGDDFFKRIARESCDYLIREIQSPEGGFWSSTDADSEGEEGKYFVWTPAQLIEVLGEDDGTWAAKVFGVTAHGNFEHGSSALTLRTQLHLQNPERFEKIKSILLKHRLTRIPPATDDKILMSWNGLAIDALAQAGLILGEEKYIDAAEGAGQFLLRELKLEQGWLRTWRSSKAQHAALLEDYAYLSNAFISLFQATGNELWLSEAEQLAQIMLQQFWNPETAVFFDTDGTDETVLHRRSSPWDGAIPSPNASALTSLIKLHALTHNDAYKKVADLGFAAVLNIMNRGPRSFTGTLRSMWMAVEEPAVAVIVGTGKYSDFEAWQAQLRTTGSSKILPVFLIRENPDSDLELFKSRQLRKQKVTLYLCKGSTCQPPSNSPSDLK